MKKRIDPAQAQGVASAMPGLPIRHDIAYRTPRSGRRLGVSGCGFMLKPALAHAYRDRIHPDVVVIYVLRGAGTFTDWRGGPARVSAGDLLVCPPALRTSLVQDADGQWAEVYLTIDASVWTPMEATGVVDVQRAVWSPGVDPALVEQFERVHHILRHGSDADQPRALLAAHELLLMARELDRHRAGAGELTPLIAQACAMLTSDFDERTSVDHVARRLGIGYERFRKLFRKHVGTSPGDYRIRRRIDRAKALIAQEGLSNQAVADRLGYRDAFTFSKQFKAVVGVSPKAFRRLV